MGCGKSDIRDGMRMPIELNPQYRHEIATKSGTFELPDDFFAATIAFHKKLCHVVGGVGDIVIKEMSRRLSDASCSTGTFEG